MNPYRYLIPAALGLVAGAANYLTLVGHTRSFELVTVVETVPAGGILEESNIKRIAVRADKPIIDAAIAFADREAFLGRPVRRPLQPDEIIYTADVKFYPPLGESEQCLALVATKDQFPAAVWPGMKLFVIRHDRKSDGPFRLLDFPSGEGPLRATGSLPTFLPELISTGLVNDAVEFVRAVEG